MVYKTRRIQSRKNITRRRSGGGKGAKGGPKPGTAKYMAIKAAEKAGAAGGENASRPAAAAAAPAAKVPAPELCVQHSMKVITDLEKAFEEYRPDQRERKLIMIKSIDGEGDGYNRKDGQFYITAWALPSPDTVGLDPKVPVSFKVVVGAPFIKHPGQDKARIACPDLIKPKAAILITQSEGGLVNRKEVAGHVGSHQVLRNVMKSYYDLTAVFPEEVKKEWLESGKLKASTRW